MAQLIAYASMWSTWPRPEIERSIEELAGKGSCAKVLADSHKSLLAWAGFSAPTTSSVSGRVGAWPLWPENTYEPVRERARRSWGKHALSMPTLPPRLVLMAPAFAQEAIELANQLATRMVDIELVRVELAVSEEGPVAQFETVVGPAPNLRPVYDAAVRLSRIDVISSNFEASGWAEEISSSAFALYCSSAPAAKIYLEWTPTGLTIFTCVPDKWDGPHGRKKLRKDFLAALPAGHGGDRFLTWKFNLPEEELLLDSVAAGIASAIVSTLAPVGRLSKPT